MILLTDNVCSTFTVHQILIYFVCMSILLSSNSCLATKTSYENHCGNIVPASKFSGYAQNPDALYLQGAYFFSTDSLKVFPNLTSTGSLDFYPFAFSTQNTSIFKVHAYLNFRNDAWKYLNFNLTGFYSMATGKICLVGSGMNTSERGSELSIFAVVKLAYPVKSNITSCLVHGTFECIDLSRNLNHIERLKILDYSRDRYIFTMASEAKEACSSVQNPVLDSLGLNASNACSYLQSLQNCLKFVLDFEEQHYSKFSRFMSFSHIHCTKDGKVNMLIGFRNESVESYYSSTLNPRRSLVSEGYWDSKKKCFCLMACRIHENSHTGECDIGLTLWFPSFTLKHRNIITGHMWSLKGIYFRKILFRSNYYLPTHPNLSYKYTENSYLRMFCDNSNETYAGGELYTNDYSEKNYMGFEFSLRDSENITMLGCAMLLSFDDIFFGNSHYLFEPQLESKSSQSIWNVSYDLFYGGRNEVDSNIRTELSAEGFYNSKLGKLCLVGCRVPNDSSSTESMDCEIQIDIQLSTSNPNGGIVRGHPSLHNGTIKSTRKKEDPLYFDTLELSSPAIYIPGATEQIHTLYVEITMVFTSLSALFIPAYFQFSNVVKNQGQLHFISITALVLFTFRYTVPIAPSIIKALHLKHRRKKSTVCSDWLEAYESTAIILIMVTPYLLIRLCQIIWTSRNVQRRTFILSILLYFLGMIILASIGYFTEWEDTAWYCGLVHDLLLLLQIFDRALKSKENALDPLFYAGTHAVRALPYLFGVYSQYCMRYLKNLDEHCSSTWCKYVPSIGVIFVVIVCLGKKLIGDFFFTPR